MISFEQAYQKVINNAVDFGTETVSLHAANGRILAENIKADRDFPPFNRSTRDGIVCNYNSIKNGVKKLEVLGTIAAGSPTKELTDETSAYEIMTGAVVPESGDTVIMYEELEFNGKTVTLPKHIEKGQNIHLKGSDIKENEVIVKAPHTIGAAEIGILASVGKTDIKVKKLPKIAVISTGNELVDVSEKPAPYQIRKSNTYSLKAILDSFKIEAEILHIPDQKEITEKSIQQALENFDVLLLSGGVSKGKYDYLPEVFDSCGVEKHFHKVLQRPGKPFWFGVHKPLTTTIFSFPGNPVSTFAGCYMYFVPWLKKSFGLQVIENTAILENDFQPHPKLTRFIPVTLKTEGGKLMASQVNQNGSGDLTSLTMADAFIRLSPKEDLYVKGTTVPFIATDHLRM